MPGTPDPVLGNDAAAFGVATGVAAFIAILPYVFRDRSPDSSPLALGGGLVYAGLCLGTWGLARFATDAFESSLFDRPPMLVGLLLIGTVVLGFQAAIPLYLYFQWGLFVPLVGLYSLTTLVLYLFLHVRGESDPLGLYASVFGPVFVTGLAVLGLAEFGIRRHAASGNDPP